MSKSKLDTLDEIENALAWERGIVKALEDSLMKEREVIGALEATRAMIYHGLEAARAAGCGETFGSKGPKPGDIMLDGSVYVGVSPDTGLALFAMPYDVSGSHTWPEARDLAAQQAHGGHENWRLPTLAELTLLHRLQEDGVIGGLTEWWYWTSDQFHSHAAWSKYLYDGSEEPVDKKRSLLVRCVRNG
ncbi:DUF1566 domain-containing protein [Polymorphum gilvum]|uniref:Lcl C-terminal domain-containing protein n=1 Tax=Polymorphum gilvum (strain LMG 25793 / CGMCC 1.9160 / SL003B-26A1) TaxID=991905 RepID=F2IUQ8_POLGS|nr:DUF1566 domain-containing protein [Polymorphum gilvum]ADZ69112.1 hypothetical protein SL003B_0680 [Polymorphum gilvum SL003B-26A1]